MSTSAITAFDPSRAQRLWLLNALHGLPPGNSANARLGLFRRGLIDESGRLTKVGRTLAKELHADAEARGLIWSAAKPTLASCAREAKRRQIAGLKEKINARLAATTDVAERQSLRNELELANLRLELIAAKEDPGDL